MGVDFEFKAKMKATIGADAQCNYRFGYYLNMPRPRDIDGCSYKLHSPTFSASGVIEIRPYILVAPYVQINLGGLYGRATTEVKPTLLIYVNVESSGAANEDSNEDSNTDSSEDLSGSAISAKFDAGVDLLIPVHLVFSWGYELPTFWKTYRKNYEIARYGMYMCTFFQNFAFGISRVLQLPSTLHLSPRNPLHIFQSDSLSGMS